MDRLDQVNSADGLTRRRGRDARSVKQYAPLAEPGRSPSNLAGTLRHRNVRHQGGHIDSIMSEGSCGLAQTGCIAVSNQQPPFTKALRACQPKVTSPTSNDDQPVL